MNSNHSNQQPVRLLVFFIGLFVILSCKEKQREVIETKPIVFEKEGTLSIYKENTDSLLLEVDIEIADNEYETQTGLMYREAMKATQGMLFVFEDERIHSFYMKNTRFPLDLIFIDSGLKVATISEEAKPLDERGISSEVPVQYVLELNAGTVRQTALQPGDSVYFRKE